MVLPSTSMVVWSTRPACVRTSPPAAPLRDRKPAGIVVVLERVGRHQIFRRPSTELLLLGPHLRRVVAAQHRVAAGIERPAHLHVPEMLFGAGDLPLFGRVENRFVAVAVSCPVMESANTKVCLVSSCLKK
jgi:hypothetical protein